MSKKRIALLDRVDSSLFSGGDTVQIQAIYNYLDSQGFKVDIINKFNVDYSQYDLAILFNLNRPFETYIYSLEVMKYGIPYFLFPIYWDMEDVIPREQLSTGINPKKWIPKSIKLSLKPMYYYLIYRSQLKKLGVGITSVHSLKKVINEILKNAKLIFPNSVSESNHLIKGFDHKAIENKCIVIKNGIEKRIELPEAMPDHLKHFLQTKYICCVGGIGPRKNQLNLVKAVTNLNVNLLIIGEPSNKDINYYNNLKKIAGNNVYFIGRQDRATVFSLMANSIGHIQPSFIETPGLASLEAASFGIPTIVSDVGPVREYFLNHVIYCNPHSITSIQESIQSLLNANSKSDQLQQFILNNYTWEKVLEPLRYIIEKN
ncbi:glycosyltransferase [Schinkia azotoformans]|uniref:glycosyltransferase n=1 Tax=Schinkia azotoformans TaxID=1454 RepID=UPI002DB91BBE|nr:glycosyltransferase [Schinkia azotoformans]MEC1744262.1 glycosyltransferase [Schinkia azotoformans]MEC1759509.1 glycosyltransferase [Schinkia azotoformans]